MCTALQHQKFKERKYLQDQRLKEGAKGLYRIGLLDKFAAARDQKRSKQRLNLFSQFKLLCEQEAAFDTMNTDTHTSSTLSETKIKIFQILFLKIDSFNNND